MKPDRLLLCRANKSYAFGAGQKPNWPLLYPWAMDQHWMQPAHTEVYSSRRISKEGTVSSPFPPPGASHFLSNVTLIKIAPFPHRCSNRDTGDNNSPFMESAHAHWEEEGPPVERAICGYGIYLFFPHLHTLFLNSPHRPLFSWCCSPISTVCMKLNLWSAPWLRARWLPF